MRVPLMQSIIEVESMYNVVSRVVKIINSHCGSLFLHAVAHHQEHYLQTILRTQ